MELGGVAFKQKHYAEAARWLRRGARLNPGDAYLADFLATVYFLQGNLDAALKYWNRIDKPLIGSVQVEPGLRVDPVLLDRAFALAPGTVLLLSDLLTTRARVEGLGVFPAFDFRLNARQDGEFDAVFSARERDGWGRNTLEALLSTFRGIGYQTIYPEYFNIGGSAINLESLVRWDKEKRRLEARVSGPLGGDPRYRYQVGLDVRNENWDLRRSFQGPAPPLGALNLRRSAVSGEVASFRRSGWTWSVGGEFSRRDYRNVSPGPGLPQEVLLKGYELKQIAELKRDLWRAPDRRFESSVRISSDTGRIWSAPDHTFERLKVRSRRAGCRGCLATISRSVNNSTPVRPSAAFPSTNSTCSAWSGITTSGCGLTSARETAAKGALPCAATISFPTGRWIRTCTAVFLV